MIELGIFLIKSILGKRGTKTETFTQTSITAPAFKQWREQRFTEIQSNTNKFLSRPHEQRVVNLGKPISRDPIQTGQNYKAPVGITGGPPMKTTKTTVTYRA